MEWHHNVWYSTYLNTILTECEYYESLDCLKHNFKEQSTIKHYFGLIWKKNMLLPYLHWTTISWQGTILTDIYWQVASQIYFDREPVIVSCYIVTGNQSSIFWHETSLIYFDREPVLVYLDREPVLYILTRNQSCIFWQRTSPCVRCYILHVKSFIFYGIRTTPNVYCL